MGVVITSPVQINRKVSMFQPIAVNTPSVGTAVEWTSGTYFDAYSSQSGITTTDLTPTNNMCWQLFFAWKPLSINTGATNVGLNTYRFGSNSWTWYASVSSSDYTIGSFPVQSAFTSNLSFSYTTGGFFEHTPTTKVTIPANRYFMIGTQGGPYYKTFKSLAENRTAQISGVNYVTAINRVLFSNWSGGPSNGIPTQVGGATSGFTDNTGYMHLISIKFSG